MLLLIFLLLFFYFLLQHPFRLSSSSCFRLFSFSSFSSPYCLQVLFFLFSRTHLVILHDVSRAYVYLCFFFFFFFFNSLPLFLSSHSFFFIFFHFLLFAFFLYFFFVVFVYVSFSFFSLDFFFIQLNCLWFNFFYFHCVLFILSLQFPLFISLSFSLFSLHSHFLSIVAIFNIFFFLVIHSSVTFSLKVLPFFILSCFTYEQKSSYHAMTGNPRTIFP
ncbi:unnamed protein product [Acanthosepion pharaonis]|uniref:Uncharacterized protein n=1 Tax=Acanthosepion pharaonis TaxID=158019 RepID=A0A812C606_ACAPH|nr:unnamed protein product [Sepia pharaonis]